MTFENKEKEIERGKEVFHSDSGLLLELGERLVATKDVAIAELVKNAYDADSAFCRVWHDRHDGEDIINVLDAGHGITLAEFRDNWMVIATGVKARERTSRKYERMMTGAKGIGRFAVRFLGRRLELQSIAHDPQRNRKTRLIADFDWSKFVPGVELSSIKVPYLLEEVEDTAEIGTHLLIKELNDIWNEKLLDEIKTEIFRITSPIQGLDAGPFSKEAEGEEPGFEVFFSAPGVVEEKESGVATSVIDYSWARVMIQHKENRTNYEITFKDEAPGFSHTHEFEESLIDGLNADIRFFPNRAGVFSRIPNIDGRIAKRWVKDHSGIAIVDHGFRMRPYGYPDDDWLSLSADKARKRRDWRSSITEKVFPSKKMIRAEKLDPSLFLPANHQLVGAVFLESRQVATLDGIKSLIPAMDRQGYVSNMAFKQIVDIVRAGLEFLAVADKRDQLRREEETLADERKEFKKGIGQAKRYIGDSTDIPNTVKRELVRSFNRLQGQFESIDKHHREARESIELMSTLGAVAGFMTHESKRLFRDIRNITHRFEGFAPSINDSELNELIEEAKDAITDFGGYLEYTDTFIKGVQVGKVDKFKAATQVDRIINKFGQFAKTRNIIVKNEIDKDLFSAPTLVALYSGVLLNLFTNAIKATLARKDIGLERQIVFRAWNEPNWHVVQVIDNGIGVPPSLSDRIWDPLFSTTTGGVDPVVSGMGLGLSIIRRLMDSIQGRIALVDPPAAFATCFEVRFEDIKE